MKKNIWTSRFKKNILGDKGSIIDNTNLEAESIHKL